MVSLSVEEVEKQLHKKKIEVDLPKKNGERLPV